MQKNIIAYVLPLSNEAFYFADGAFVSLLDTEGIYKLLCPPDILEKGYLCIYDSQGKLLASNNGKVLPLTEQMTGEISLEGEKINVISINSKESGLKVMVGIPGDFFVKKIGRVMSILRTLSLLSIVLGVLLALYLAYRNSLPLRRLLQTVSDIYNLKDRKKNAFSDLQNVFLELNRLKESYRNEIASLESSVQLSLFDRLIKDGVHSFENQEEYIKHLDFLLGGYRLFIMRFHEPQELKGNSSEHEYQALMKVIAARVIKKV